MAHAPAHARRARQSRPTDRTSAVYLHKPSRGTAKHEPATARRAPRLHHACTPHAAACHPTRNDRPRTPNDTSPTRPRPRSPPPQHIHPPPPTLHVLNLPPPPVNTSTPHLQMRIGELPFVHRKSLHLRPGKPPERQVAAQVPMAQWIRRPPPAQAPKRPVARAMSPSRNFPEIPKSAGWGQKRNGCAFGDGRRVRFGPVWCRFPGLSEM